MLRPSRKTGSAVAHKQAMAKPSTSVPSPMGTRPHTLGRARRNLLLDLPIFWRLTLGFLIAALIAATAAGISGLQRVESLSKEASSYQSLLKVNTELTTADTFLQILDTALHTLVTDATSTIPSTETLATDQSAVQSLIARYDASLSQFERDDLLDRHPDQVALLGQIGQANKAGQQNTLAASASRTWQVYRDAVAQVTEEVRQGDLPQAQIFLRAQGEPTHADAQSALRALIQFNGRIAASVRAATLAEQRSQLVASLIAAILAFLGIALVGLLISSTLIQRLRQLRRVTQAVEHGELEERIVVVGRDEIASVSASVNGMLDTIVGLLDVTRRQRDALTNAAERLFVDVRVAGAGDLRMSAAVSSDPIGMLANAFNFTIGRFRRFVLRTQGAVDQLDVLGRQQLNRAEAFLTAMHAPRPAEGNAVHAAAPPPYVSSSVPGSVQAGESEFVRKAVQARELVHKMARDGASWQLQAASDLAEQAYLSAGRVSQLALAAHMGLQQRDARSMESALRQQMEELRTLGTLLERVGSATAQLHQTNASLLGTLDASLVQLADSVRTSGLAMPLQSGSASALPSAHKDELLRLSHTLARDMTTMARHLLGITEEVRAGVVPFRLSVQPQEDALYVPGTGYDGVVRSSVPPYSAPA